MTSPGYVAKGPNTRDDWETPEPLFRALDRVFRFTLDAAADEQNRKCERWLEGPHDPTAERHFPELEDPGHDGGWRNLCRCGLCADWMEHTVWLNPPYGSGLDKWVAKCHAESLDGATVVALLPNGTDTEWFKDIWLGASEVWFLSGRVQFVGTTSSNPKGSIVAVWRPEPLGDVRDGVHVRLWDWRGERA